MNPGTRVRATERTRGFRPGAEGTVLPTTDPDDPGAVLVSWEGSSSGPSWTDESTVEVIGMKLTRQDYVDELRRRLGGNS